MASLYLQNQAAMLIAYFMDDYECNNLCENVLDLSESWLSGPVANSMISEIRLIGRTLFYLPLLVGNGRSIGQDFANLSLSFRSENLLLENQKRNLKFQPLDHKILCLVSLAYIFLPYLNERKEFIFDQIHEQIRILSEDECLANSPNSINLPNLSSTSFHATSVIAPSDSTSTQSLVDKAADRESMFVVLFRAIAISWYSVAGSNAQRMTTAVKLLQDMHNYYFLLHGRYFELALRLCQVELVSHIKRTSNIKLQKLSYLLGLRVALLAYYGARVLAKEVDAQIAASEAVHRETNRATAGVAGSGDSSMSAHKNNGANSIGGSGTSCSGSVTGGSMIGSRSSNKCVLCLDALTHPTAVPCGHVFCWDCILPHTMSTAGESNRDGDDQPDGHRVSDGQTSRCPVCRADFPVSKVRALYSY